jgi:hypothetical protein
MRSKRYQELQELLEIMPELTIYDPSFKPKSRSYRYCRECRVFFNNPPSEGLGRCPICGGKLSSGPKRKRVAKYVDPLEHLLPWPQPRRQTTLGDFLPGLPRQTILDELWGLRR